MNFPIPPKLLERICINKKVPIAIAVCPDFEFGSWRYNRLAEHLLDWLPDVALRPDERKALLYEPYKQLSRACRRLFDTDDPERRGEIGEILLHALCRQEFSTTPFVARLFYKMRTNDSVTSIDVAHLLYNKEDDDLELWLGEAKLYENINKAKYAALKSIEPLWDKEFLHEMKALIGPKVDPSTPYAEKLTWLFSEETSLDQIVKRIVIPICIAANHPATVSAIERTEPYVEQIKLELEKTREYFATRVPAEVAIVCILVPMDSKEKLDLAFNQKVQALL